MNSIVVNRLLGLLAWGGVLVAGLLTVSHWTGRPLVCGESGGCEAVAAHSSSVWFGLPVAVYGLAAYLVLAALALVRAMVPDPSAGVAAKLGFGISGAGTMASLYLTYVSVFVIGAVCPWCLASAGIMVVTFVLHGVLASMDARPSATGLVDMLIAAVGCVVAIGGIGIAMGGSPARSVSSEITAESLAPKPEYWKGDLDAKVKIVEYADVFCPACRTGHPQVTEMFTQAKGRIRWAFRGYPLFEIQGHEMSLPATMASEVAAESGRFWAFLDAAFSEDVANMKTFEQIAQIVTRVGGDGEGFLRRINAKDDGLLTIVDEDKRRAQRLGVDGTPMYIVFAEGQKTMIAPGVDALRRLLDKPEYARLWRTDGG